MSQVRKQKPKLSHVVSKKPKKTVTFITICILITVGSTVLIQSCIIIVGFPVLFCRYNFCLRFQVWPYCNPCLLAGRTVEEWHESKYWSVFFPSSFQSLTVPDANLRQRRTSYVDQRRGSAVSQRRASRPVTMHMSRKAVEIDASSEGSGTDYSDDEVLMLKKDDGFRPVKGQPGMYYKVSDNPCYLYTQNRNNFREYSWVFEPFLIGQCVSETLRFFEEGFAITSSAFCRPTRDSACNIQDFQRVYLLSNIWLVIAVFPCSVDTDNWHSSSSSEVWVWELLLTRLNVGFLIVWPIKAQVNMGGSYVKEATWS